MVSDDQTWKRCSTCKGDIAFQAPYFSCSVSTCNRKGTDFVFCSVECWDGHVPVLRHRDAWADEKTAPTAEEWAREQGPEAPPARSEPPRPEARRVVTDTTPVASHGAVPRDVLVVVSKLKQYIRLTSGMSTSDDVIGPLSDRLRSLCDDAIEYARADGRKTVMARDLRRQS